MSSSKVDIWNRALRRIGESARVQDEDEQTRAGEACRAHYDDLLREVLEELDWPWATRQRPLTEISEQTTSYTGDGSDTDFDVPHPFIDSSQVSIEVDGVEVDEDDYTVTPVSDGVPTAYVTFDAAPAAAAAIVITVATSRNGWEYVYAAPADMVKAIALIAEDDRYSQLSVADRIPFAVQLNDAGTGFIICTDAGATDFEVLEYVAKVTHVPAMPAKFIDALAWRIAVELALDIPKDHDKARYCQSQYELAVSKAGAQSQNVGFEGADPETPSVAARG